MNCFKIITLLWTQSYPHSEGVILEVEELSDGRQFIRNGKDFC